MLENSQMTSRKDLIEYLESGCKPRSEWLIGYEQEAFLFDINTYQPLPYSGNPSIKAVLQAYQQHGWSAIYENGALIALEQGRARITLEPAGQFELSAAPVQSLTACCQQIVEHHKILDEISQQLGIGYLFLGFHPSMTLKDAPMMPKQRYDIMRAYMPTKGQHGLDMMHRTASLQVNLDFENEADMVKKYRVGLALQPLLGALFSNSPFTEGQFNGYQSYRNFVWTDTDPDRTGLLPFVFEEGFGFERYVDYALDVPMYFVHRENYINAAGLSFRDFMSGTLSVYPNEKPTLLDWQDHLSTLFPDVRLKTYLELRGTDSVNSPLCCALGAFWYGLFYNQTALDSAWDIIKQWPFESILHLRSEVPKHGLETPFQTKSNLWQYAHEFLSIAEYGLNNIAATPSEQLQPLWEIVKSRQTPTDRLLKLMRANGIIDMEAVFKHSLQR